MADIHVPQGYKVGIKLKTPATEIQKKVLLGLRDSLNEVMPQVANKVREELSTKTDPIFLSSVGYHLIVNERGRGDLGIPNGEEVDRLKVIINKLSQQIVVEPVRFTVSNKTFRTGGLNIFMFKSDFQELIDLPEAHVITEKGEDLPWLEWLLLGSNKVLISGYDVKFGNYNSRTNKQGMAISRSGIAIMVPKESFSWGLPYAGTKDRNWITSAIDVAIALEYIQEIVQESLEKWLTRFGQA